MRVAKLSQSLSKKPFPIVKQTNNSNNNNNKDPLISLGYGSQDFSGGRCWLLQSMQPRAREMTLWLCRLGRRVDLVTQRYMSIFVKIIIEKLPL